MIYKLLPLIFFALLTTFASITTYGQEQEKEDFPKSITETLAKSRIEREKKDFQELLDRGNEAAKISEELDESFNKNKNLTVEDQKKLERLEKISKKIREELGANDSSSSNDSSSADDEVKLSTVSDAIDKLKNITEKLADELSKTSRYTISAVAVQRSNTLLRVVRFIRQNKN